MRLAASLVVRNELGRYLEPCVDHLLRFCDLVVVLDDASDDGTREWLVDHPDERVHVELAQEPGFFVHEGATRQRLLEATLGLGPTHVLAIDADELVTDGPALAEQLARDPDVPAWTLPLREVWRADADRLWLREDGAWGRGVAYVWHVPPELDPMWRIMNAKLACRRVPPAVFRQRGRPLEDVEILHFGWTDEAARLARHGRYVEHDGGRFHARRHLDSILWPDDRVTVRGVPWPDGPVFDGMRGAAVAA